MYLEERIANLEAKIDQLVALMLNNKIELEDKAPAPVEDKAPTPVEEKAPAPVEDKTSFASNADFSTAVKALVRKKPTIKGQVKTVIANHGYTVLADVNEADYDSIYSAVEAL